jgi:hypothetical protein
MVFPFRQFISYVCQFHYFSMLICFFYRFEFEKAFRVRNRVKFIGKILQFCDPGKVCIIGFEIPQRYFSLFKGFKFLYRHDDYLLFGFQYHEESQQLLPPGYIVPFPCHGRPGHAKNFSISYSW